MSLLLLIGVLVGAAVGFAAVTYGGVALVFWLEMKDNRRQSGRGDDE